MNEYYLEWMFLRELLEYWFREHFPKGEDVLVFQCKQYDIEAIKVRFVELGKMLLKDYELDKDNPDNFNGSQREQVAKVKEALYSQSMKGE